jgi:hypothetical protein
MVNHGYWIPDAECSGGLVLTGYLYWRSPSNSGQGQGRGLILKASEPFFWKVAIFPNDPFEVLGTSSTCTLTSTQSLTFS